MTNIYWQILIQESHQYSCKALEISEFARI
jgi:hypothetical protein